jgi:hypothetical protein
MGIWVERDEKTKTVVLCTSDDKDCGAGIKPTRRIRLQPRNAAILGAQLIAAADEDLTAFVGESREVIETGTEVYRQGKSAVELFGRVRKIFGGLK